MELQQNKQNKTKMHKNPAFDEDAFDLNEHKKAANTAAQTKAQVKRVRRKVALGRIIITILAFAVCALLWIMVSEIAGLL